jgi:L-ascorbate metabolism protein UlaG (beta-lactamase superfamily)
VFNATSPATDTIKTASGDLTITFLGHASLYFTFGGLVVHVDPWAKLADYAKLPGADLILITHDHQDHFDSAAVAAIRKNGAPVVATRAVAAKLPETTALANGDAKDVLGLRIEAVPAYNIMHKRDSGEPFHPKGDGNGYVVSFGETRVYIAGDTENTPEMKALRNIDVAFLPMNLPYTMTPEMAADAAKAFGPKILYPYHTGDTDLSRLTVLMRDTPGVDVRLRKMP